MKAVVPELKVNTELMMPLRCCSTHLCAARLALEALRVPGAVQRRDALVQDGAAAPRAPDTEQPIRGQYSGHMIYPGQSEANVAHERVVPGTEEGVVALLAKWFAVSLKKVLSSQLHVTLAAGKAAGVPGASQGGDHLQFQPIRGQNSGHVIYIDQSEASVNTILTWPTMGLSQAAHTPFCVVLTPCLLMSSCRSPSIASRLGTPPITWSHGCQMIIRLIFSRVTHWLINITTIHFEVVQGSHQVVQF